MLIALYIPNHFWLFTTRSKVSWSSSSPSVRGFASLILTRLSSLSFSQGNTQAYHIPHTCSRGLRLPQSPIRLHTPRTGPSSILYSNLRTSKLPHHSVGCSILTSPTREYQIHCRTSLFVSTPVIWHLFRIVSTCVYLFI